MNVNCAKLYKQFKKEQEALRRTYLEAGMTEKQIDELYTYDLNELARNISYWRHTQFIDEAMNLADDGKNPLLGKFLDEMTCEMEEPITDFFWIRNIDSERLAARIECLCDRDLMILDLIYRCQLTQKEVARVLNISQSTVAYSVSVILAYLRGEKRTLKRYKVLNNLSKCEVS